MDISTPAIIIADSTTSMALIRVNRRSVCGGSTLPFKWGHGCLDLLLSVLPDKFSVHLSVVSTKNAWSLSWFVYLHTSSLTDPMCDHNFGEMVSAVFDCPAFVVQPCIFRLRFRASSRIALLGSQRFLPYGPLLRKAGSWQQREGHPSYFKSLVDHLEAPGSLGPGVASGRMSPTSIHSLLSSDKGGTVTCWKSVDWSRQAGLITN